MLKAYEVKRLADLLAERDKYVRLLKSLIYNVEQEHLGRAVIASIGSRLDCLSAATVGAITYDALCEALKGYIKDMDNRLKDKVDLS